MARNKFACILLCVLSIQGIQVQALLNITREAIDFSHKIIEQAQRVSVYQKKEDVANQIAKLSEILDDFYEKNKGYRNFIGDYLQLKCRTEEIAYTCFNIFDKKLARRNPDFEFSEFASYKTAFKKYSDAVFNLYRIKKFVVENDFNLVGVKTYNDILNSYHSFITTPDPASDLTIVDVITREEEARSCNTQSQQLILFNLIREISGMDVRGFAVVQYSLAVLKAFLESTHLIKDENNLKVIKEITIFWDDSDIIKRMKQRESDLISRNTRTYNLLKSKSRSLDRLVRTCSDETIIEKLPAIFQKYIINEVDMDENGSCRNTCPDFKEAKVRECYDKGSICDRQTWCNGTLWDCGNNIGSPTMICPSVRQGTSDSTRYKYLKVNGNIYGEKDWCPSEYRDLVEAKSWTRGFVECTYCMCTCENADNHEHHSFSLRPVVSDINSNLVITNFQLKKLNGIFHIQIEQSELLPNGMTGSGIQQRPDTFTVSDPDIEEGEDYHSISWKKRAVSLDMVSALPGHVLTGLQLVLHNDVLKLKIRVTSMNFESGELYAEQTQWLSNDVNLQDRIDLDLQNLGEYFDNKLKKSAYFRFTTSALEIDAGQRTIPAIETDSVGVKHTPLSGAGLYLRRVQGNAVLAFKAETFDFSPYL